MLISNVIDALQIFAQIPVLLPHLDRQSFSRFKFLQFVKRNRLSWRTFKVISLPLDVFWFGHLKTSTSRGEVPFMLENPCYSRDQTNAKCSFKNTYWKQQYFRKEPFLKTPLPPDSASQHPRLASKKARGTPKLARKKEK